MAHVLRPEPAGFRAAVALGMAMQLSNIARDVAEDLGNGRVYLPSDLVTASAVRDALRSANPAATGQVLAATRGVLRVAETLLPGRIRRHLEPAVARPLEHLGSRPCAIARSAARPANAESSRGQTAWSSAIGASCGSSHRPVCSCSATILAAEARAFLAGLRTGGTLHHASGGGRLASLDTDVLILGGGCAGLSLATALAQWAPQLRVHILESRRSYTRDRTWCFWHAGSHPFSAGVTHRWPGWRVRHAGARLARRATGTPTIIGRRIVLRASHSRHRAGRSCAFAGRVSPGSPSAGRGLRGQDRCWPSALPWGLRLTAAYRRHHATHPGSASCPFLRPKPSSKPPFSTIP